MSGPLKYIMSKLFFDHLLDFKKLDNQIKKVAKTSEEREEIWLLVDEIIHHRALGCILDHLPVDSHEEFMTLFHKSPHNQDLLFGYLKNKVSENIEELLSQELGIVSDELLGEIQNPKS